MKNRKDYYCIFGGGGIRGVAYVGALKALEEANVNIKGFAGSSVGAIIATLTAIGYTTDEIKDIVMEVGLGLFSDLNLDIVKGFSFSKGEIFSNWIKELVEKKFYGSKYNKKNEPVRFKDLDKDLVIMSVNLTDSEFHEFSRYTTPDFEIAKAVRVSVSMPGLFQPVENGETLLADGDLMKSWPMWRLTNSLRPDNCRILEFRLEDMHRNKKIDNLVTYINAVYNTVTGFATKFITELYSQKDKFDYIRLNTKNVSVVDFTISKDKKEEMIEIGYQTTKEYFEKILPKKREKLFKEHYGTYMMLLDIEHYLKKDNYRKANEVLGELFINLCEYKRTMDVDIYNKIIKFKDIFKANYTKKQIGFLNFDKTENKNVIMATFNEVLSIMKEKTEELKK